jgi:mevalonate kinase
MDLEKKYYAKLMLVGEYAVILGGDALTVPLKEFSASIAHRDRAGDNERAIRSINNLRNLAIYLESLPKNSFFASPDLASLGQVVTSGFYIESSVPEGYGVGSSGVVTAIVYDQFFTGQEGLQFAQMKKDLATIESFFHGRSSGVDALSCYLGKCLLFETGDRITIPDFDAGTVPGGYRFFLVDSASVFDTGPLVQHFMEELKKPLFEQMIRNEYLPMNLKLIEVLTGKREGDPGMLLRAVSDLQYREFRRMIPETMEDLWLHGQLSGEYYLKLNGSGGGFILGICHENLRERVEEVFEGRSVIWVE